MNSQNKGVTGDEVLIRDASFPKPFSNGLEFNPPVHGTWNIVHIGLQMPEAVQIYVCAKNCMRGVVLTAAEMNASDRFSFVILKEEDMVRGGLDDVTIAGVIDVIQKRIRAGQKPKAVQLFPVCVHHFLGTDYKRMYRILEETFPDIDFYQAYMDPIMQKKGFTPDQKLRRAMFEHFRKEEPERKTAAILGCDFRIEDSSEIVQLLQANGWRVRQIQDCHTYEEFLELGKAELFISVYPPGLLGTQAAAKRLGRKFLYLPSTFDQEEVGAQLDQLAETCGFDARFSTQEQELEEALEHLHQKIGETPIQIDGTAHPRPLGLARLLSAHGMRVEKVYLDAISPEEEKAFLWLKENCPELVLSAIMHVRKRTYVSGQAERQKTIAIGQKAAYFADTPHFVNIVQGFGLHGLDGAIRMCRLIEEAFEEEKDTRDIVPRKGLGCESCLW